MIRRHFLHYEVRHQFAEKNQLDWNSINILLKEHDYWNRISNEAYFIIKHRE